MENKTAKLLILGSSHLDNPNRDVVNRKMDNVLAAKRQKELIHLTNLIAKFQPTKIAVEYPKTDQFNLSKKYQSYLKNEYQLTANETDQIGFRLAKLLGHDSVYGVDWFEPPAQSPPRETVDFQTFAQEHNQMYLLEKAMQITQVDMKKGDKILQEGSLVDHYIFQNQEEQILLNHQPYFQIAQIGDDENSVGINWIQNWYGRNFKIFIHLTELISTPNERILLIIGSGHLYLLNQFAKDSSFFKLKSPLEYLI